jgi:hypothetical protein
MYFEDLSPYEYRIDANTDGLKILNVGWIDAEHNFSRGETTKEFRDALLELCLSVTVNKTRGFYRSPFQTRLKRGFMEAIVIKKGWFRKKHLGSAEVEVVDSSNQILYRAPDLLYHYVVDVNYLPPEPFIQAVCECYGRGKTKKC